ncbi:protein LIAT1 isoform X2 [Lacerta agilis]|uniref:protein LIAT1 isoform X2 n=1 Tax=Lacerta agilis TaxID=80427 RepID=UPI00141980DD|nr:protein LIAT1 isoform X2 [Lacerta agilis]
MEPGGPSAVALETRPRSERGGGAPELAESFVPGRGQLLKRRECGGRGGPLPHLSMPAQQQHAKEQEIPRRMDVCRQDPLSEGEGAKTKKPPAKERPHTPQTMKKARKKKKKKAAPDNGKPEGKSKKHSVLVTSPHELTQHQTGPGPTPQGAAPKATPGKPLSASVSLLTQDNPVLSNESLRWDGVLDDPIAEEERLWTYRLNRRKRYGEYMQQNLPPEPSFTFKHLPQHYVAPPQGREQLLRKSMSSTTTSAPKADQSGPNSKISTNVSKRQSALMPSVSQKIA